MKTTLIEHNNELYLVSDEEKGVGFFFNNQINSFLASTQKSSPKGLIIPSDLMEVFKGVDMAEIAYTNLLEKSEQDKNHVGYGKGLNGVEKSRWKSIYNQALQDNKEKRFTLEDMKTAIVKALQFGREIKDKDLKGFVYEILPYTDKYLQSLSIPKKEWKVEIERYLVGMNEGATHENHGEPKLTKNSEGKECYTIKSIL